MNSTPKTFHLFWKTKTIQHMENTEKYVLMIAMQLFAPKDHVYLIKA